MSVIFCKNSAFVGKNGTFALLSKQYYELELRDFLVLFSGFVR